MKLAYVTIFGSSDIHAWSGLGVYMHSALQREDYQVETIADLKYQCDYVSEAKEVLYSRFLAKGYSERAVFCGL